MKKYVVSSSLLLPLLLGLVDVPEAFASEIQTNIADEYVVNQVTSVSQLSDVRPTDWAFQALQSLVERYGVISGYPDKTFRGDRTLTRYEFAAGLNAAMDRINELIGAGVNDLVKKDDLETLKKLQEEFAAELATLRGRVDALESRTTILEKQQFSTTTKLSGEVIFDVSSSFSGEGDGFFNGQGSPILRRDIPNLPTLGTSVGNGAQTVTQNFTPADLSSTIGTTSPALTPTQLSQAITAAAGNLQTNPAFLPAGSGLTPLANVLGASLGLPSNVILQGFANAGINVNSLSDQDRLSLVNFHTLFALSLLGADNARPVLVSTKPVDDNLTFGNVVFLTLNTSFTGQDLLKTRFVASNVPFYTDRTGALESAVDWNEDSTGNALQLKELYYTFRAGQARVFVGVKDLFAEDIVPTTANLQDDRIGLFFRNNPLSYRYAGGTGVGFNYPINNQFNIAAAFLSDETTSANANRGITSGGNTVFGQLTFTPNSKLTAALTYNHAYAPKYLGLEATLIPTLFLAREEAIIQNAIALNLSYAVSPKFNISGWVGYEWADSQSSSAEFERSTWALNLGFPDLFQKGNYGGVSIGAFPYVTQEAGRFLEEQDLPLLAQVFYGFRVSDNITIQPGLFIIDSPTGDSKKETTLIGSVRVKFVF